MRKIEQPIGAVIDHFFPAVFLIVLNRITPIFLCFLLNYKISYDQSKKKKKIMGNIMEWEGVVGDW